MVDTGTYGSTAIVSTNYHFVMVDIGTYGSASNGGIFNTTSFNRKWTMVLPDLPAPTKLPEENDGYAVPYVFVGDETFPLKENLM